MQEFGAIVSILHLTPKIRELVLGSGMILVIWEGIWRSRHLGSWLIAPRTRSSKEKRNYFTVF